MLLVHAHPVGTGPARRQFVVDENLHVDVFAEAILNLGGDFDLDLDQTRLVDLASLDAVAGRSGNLLRDEIIDLRVEFPDRGESQGDDFAVHWMLLRILVFLRNQSHIHRHNPSHARRRGSADARSFLETSPG